MGEPHFDREALIAEVAKRHKILLDPDDPAFALITINEIVLSRAIGIVEAKLAIMEQRLAQISEKQAEAAKAIAEAIITAGAAYVSERLKDAGGDLIEKVRTSIALNQGNKQSVDPHADKPILIYSAIPAAFTVGFVSATLLYIILLL